MPRRSRTPDASRLEQSLVGALICALLVPQVALAGPSEMTVLQGEIDPLQSDGTLHEVTTHSRTSRAGFDTLDLGHEERLRVHQPSAKSRFFAEDWSGDETRIDGSVESNGLVGIINPYGIFVGDRALFDVSSLVLAGASTDETTLNSGRYHFGDVTGDVQVAAGAQIHADRAVLLVGRTVANYGHIQVPRGGVVLAAGDSVSIAKVAGRLVVRGDTLVNDPGAFALTQGGSIDAERGYVSLTAGDGYSLAMNHSGITRARDIEIDGGGTGLVQVDGSLDASRLGKGQRGGEISVTGERLDVGGSLDASGDAGGGRIRVGGDLRGQGPLANARRTYVDDDATLRADAVRKGSGGTVIVYADEATGFWGEISAQGGATAGDGGFAEISGQALAFDGEVRLGAANGRRGVLLFDPVDIEIQGGGTLDPSLRDPARIHFGDDPLEGEPFVITEATLEGGSIEGDVILEATNSIVATGSLASFDNDAGGGGEVGVVRMFEGQSLIMRTRNGAEDGAGSPRPAGIDLDGVDGGDLSGLEWRVTSTPSDDDLDAVRIELETGRGSGSVDAAIAFGRLFADGGVVALRTDGGDISGSSLETTGLFGFNGNEADDAITVRVDRGDVTIVDLATRHRADDADDLGVGGPILIEVEEGDVTLTRVRTEGGPRSDQANTVRGLVVDLDAGDIAIDHIDTSGLDGEDPANAFVMGVPREVRRAGFGGDVVVTTDEGNVDIRRIDTFGGNAFQEAGNVAANGDGGNGGQVGVNAGGDGVGSGHVTLGAGVAGGIDSSGGTGYLEEIDFDGLDDVNGADFLAGRGGNGGNLQISGSGTVLVDGTLVGSGGDSRANAGATDDVDFFTAQFIAVGGTGATVLLDGGSRDDPDTAEVEPENTVRVLADIISRGGNASGSVAVEDPITGDDGFDLGAAGGTGGSVQIGATGPIEVGAAGNTVTFDVSGGAATPDATGIRLGSGGSAQQTFEPIQIGRRLNSGLSSGDVTVHADLVADGGAGNDGGNGGVVDVSAAEASVTFASGSARANGGASQGNGDAVALSEDGTRYAFEDVGGSGGSIRVQGDGAVAVDVDLSALGGDSERGRGGDGGSISFLALSGAVTNTTGSFDVSGGNGTTQGDPIVLSDDALDDPDTEVVPFVEGLHTIQGGGTGGTLTASASDGPVTLLGGSRAAAGISTNPAAEDGSAGAMQINAAGDVDVQQIGDLAFVNVNQVARDASTDLLTALGGRLDVDALDVTMEGDYEHRVVAFDTPDADTALSYTLTVAEDEELGEEVAPSIDIVFGTDVGSVGTLRHEDETHALLNNNGDLRGLDPGAGAHVIVGGTLRLGADDIGVDDGDRLVVDGAGGELRLASGALSDGEDGAIHVRVVRSHGGLAGIDVEQRELAETDIELDAGGGSIERIHILPDDTGTTMRVASLDTEAYGAGFAYALRDARNPNLDQPEADLDVTPLSGVANLGGTLVLDVQGALRLGAGSIAANDHDIALLATGPIGAVAGSEGIVTLDDPGSLLVLAEAGKGQPTSDVGLVVTSDDRVAVNVVAEGDVTLEVQGAPGMTGDLVVGRLEPDIGDVPGLVPGVNAGGDVVLRTAADSTIVLGEPGVAGEADLPLTVVAGGEVVFGAGAILIDNERTTLLDEDTNDAFISSGGDVTFEGAIDTAAGTRHARLLVDARGTTRYQGDVGTTRALAVLDTTDLDLGTASRDETRTFRVGQGRFDRIDGLGTAALETDASAVAGTDLDEQLTLEGNVGGHTQLEGFQADAPRIHFTRTERVETGAGGIRLNTDEDLMGATPPDATIADRSGHLRLESQGDIEIGELHKLSTLGTLRIKTPGRVTANDLNAHKIVITSPDIRMRQRAPAPVAPDVDEDGAPVFTNPMDPSEDDDLGVDWVANQINTSSAIQLVGMGGTPRLVIGTGGLRTANLPAGVQVVRFTEDFNEVTPSRTLGSDGETLLDLTAPADAPAVLGNPSREIQRPEPQVGAIAAARLDRAAAAPLPVVTAAEVLALLRSEPGTISRDDRSALATPRAAEIDRFYHERILNRDHRAGLRAIFTVAYRAYREEGARRLDGAEFYTFLASSDLHAEARQEIDDLAAVLAQVDLLGMSAEDTREVQQSFARAFVEAAAVRDFDLAQVLAAVDASPIGLLQ